MWCSCDHEHHVDRIEVRWAPRSRPANLVAVTGPFWYVRGSSNVGSSTTALARVVEDGSGAADGAYGQLVHGVLPGR